MTTANTNDKCVECGKSAVIWIRDSIDTTKKGDKWTSAKPKGDPIPYCTDHRRNPVIYYPDGRVKEEIQPYAPPIHSG